jgi:glycosyltransferase involved in cell wall biosynthesis
MKLLLIHSYYQQRGGEDAVFEAERDALIESGVEVETYSLKNADYAKKPKWQQFLALFWNHAAYKNLRKKLQLTKPDIVHVHNIFPFLSPSILWAARAEKIPVIVTLHNYRLMCANGLLYCAGSICEKCVGKFLPLPAILFGCYRNDRWHSTAVVLSMVFHRLIGSWKIPKKYIAPTEFAANKLTAVLPNNRMVVKPHFAQDLPRPTTVKNGHVVCVGRLSEEKGIDWLAEIWDLLPTNITLDIVGVGDLPIRSDKRIIMHGYLPPEKLRVLIAEASLVVIPSRCFETFNSVVIEAFAAGTAVIAPKDSAPASLITERVNGALFEREDAETMQQLMVDYCLDFERATHEGNQARSTFERNFQKERNLKKLRAIYEI